MRRLLRTMILGSLVTSAQCGNATAPVAEPPIDDPPTGSSPSGRIAFVSEEPGGRGGFVYVANADGSGVRQLPGGQAYYSRPRWSPDRRRILVGRWEESSGGSIVAIDVDGPFRMVTLAQGVHPAWSPDGKKIAYSTGLTGPEAGIHVMDADGHNVRRLTSANDPAQCSAGSSANDLKPDWSPDGGKIVFERQVHTSEEGYDCGLDGWGYIPYVWVTNADGTGLRRLRSTELLHSDSDPAWSPDGRFIAYAIFADGLYVIDSQGAGPPQRITVEAGGYPLSPVWSPDGKKLLFLAASPPTNKLAVVDLETGTTQVLSFPTVNGLLLDPAWSR